MKLGISVIIPNLNGEKVLHFCLRSLVNQTLEKDKYEIIVVDNNSNDRSREICEYYSQKYSIPKIKCVYLTKNLGYGNAINIGARLAQFKYILATNNDIIFHPYYLEMLLNTLEYVRRYYKNVVAAVGLHFYHPEVTCINSAGGLLSIVGGHYRYYRFCLDRDNFINYMKRYVIRRQKKIAFSITGFGTGAALLIDRNVFLRIGGFYKLYFAGVEEFDLGMLLNLLNLRTIFVPTAILYHKESLTFGRRGLYASNKIKYYLPGNYIYVSTLISGVDRVIGYLFLLIFSLFILVLSLIKRDKNIARSIIEVYKFITSNYFKSYIAERRKQIGILIITRYNDTKTFLKKYNLWKRPINIIVDVFRSLVL
jgi:GT2 family glycosyltransferase